LKTVSDATHTFTYAYEPENNLLASIEGPVHAVAYDYEPNRDVMTEIDNRANDLQGASISKYAYTYDALARRNDRTQSGSAINTASTDDFAYNPRSEVTGSTNSVETADAYNPTYAFDKIGNRKTSTGYFASSYTANELNQYSQVSSLSTQPSYDVDGNLVASGSWTYTWNNENRLASATNGTTTIDFTYDYQGRLVKKDDGTDIEIYVYDGWNRIATFRSQVSGFSLQTSYLWGLDLSGTMQGAGGVGGLLSETTHSSPLTTHYSLFDANGNIMQKLDGTGAVVMSVDYDPFGNIIDGTLVGEYGFSTKPLIGGIQWYYYGFRYYDPETGRWLNRDPIGEWGGRNLYLMIANDPVNLSDFLGLFPDALSDFQRSMTGGGHGTLEEQAEVASRIEDKRRFNDGVKKFAEKKVASNVESLLMDLAGITNQYAKMFFGEALNPTSTASDDMLIDSFIECFFTSDKSIDNAGTWRCDYDCGDFGTKSMTVTCNEKCSPTHIFKVKTLPPDWEPPNFDFE